jgi:LmbE family N-acetylglucosaminyl deacetylase
MASFALVVSHPDDEALFFGGLVLSPPGYDYPWGVDWTVICCSVPRVDPIRAWKFFDACQALSATGVPVSGRLLPYQEPEPTEPLEDERLALLDLEPYDRIVTHGAEGEYGHRHHVSLSRFIHERWGHKEIWSCCPPGKTDYNRTIRLSPQDLNAKTAALKAYDHVLPYEGVAMPKWQALLKRYCENGSWELGTERYRIHRP